MLGDVGVTAVSTVLMARWVQVWEPHCFQREVVVHPPGSRERPATHPGPRLPELCSRPLPPCPRRCWEAAGSCHHSAVLSRALQTSFAGIHLGPALGRPVCREALCEPVQVRASGRAGTWPGGNRKVWPFQRAAPWFLDFREQPRAPSGLHGKLGPAAGQGAEPRESGGGGASGVSGTVILPWDLGNPGCPSCGRWHPQSAGQS